MVEWDFRKLQIESLMGRSEVSSSVFDLFKTTTKSNELSERAKETIVLKFE